LAAFGAGKTTSVARLAQRLTDRGLKVGQLPTIRAVIGGSAMLWSRLPGESQLFLLRFNPLVDAAQRLTKRLGGCVHRGAGRQLRTDRDGELSARFTWCRPLRCRGSGSGLALRFRTWKGGKFSEKVIYIYRKQLEEAI
jgi:hypothetical protein